MSYVLSRQARDLLLLAEATCFRSPPRHDMEKYTYWVVELKHPKHFPRRPVSHAVIVCNPGKVPTRIQIANAIREVQIKDMDPRQFLGTTR
jgi:hypothetical protein